ncbi:hypothetical protein EJ110_NYTH11345 [Nymphaea thermarum]|nr:hypothetical protein EJ110_NYTH11345 [Nymphaea thermarum]
MEPVFDIDDDGFDTAMNTKIQNSRTEIIKETHSKVATPNSRAISSSDINGNYLDLATSNSKGNSYDDIQGNDALEVYVAKFKAICDDLAAIGKFVGDKERAFWLLQGLGKGYEPFVIAMLKPPVPSYKELVSLLQSLEVRNKFLNTDTFPQVAFCAQCEGGQKRYQGTYHNS